MLGPLTGLAGQLKSHGLDTEVTHCIIHRFVLANKSIGFDEMLETSNNLVKYFRGGKKWHNRRTLRKYLAAKNAPFTDLLLFCEVRWLSRGDFLERLWILLPFVKDFLQQKSDTLKNVVSNQQNKSRGRKPKTANKQTTEDIELEKINSILEKICRHAYKISLAFSVDLIGHMNKANVKLQGRNHTMGDYISTVDNFKGRFN